MNFFRKMMAGRYGGDQFNICLLLISLLLSLIFNILGLGFLSLIAYIPLIYAFFRMFSRKTDKRRAENVKFMLIWQPIKRAFVRKFQMLKQSKEYRFFRCPSCGEYARVPKKAGKVEIKCRKCGNSYRKKA